MLIQIQTVLLEGFLEYLLSRLSRRVTFVTSALAYLWAPGVAYLKQRGV